jgi:BR serine/threonine kinase
MRLCDHPHILKVCDYLQSPRHIYIVLEYASRGGLFDFLVESKTLPEDRARNFFRQIIYGLEYLHSLGVCHRDLKPENILLDANLNVKIADFGFARFVKSNVTDTSCGSPHYAAPEIVKGNPYNGKAADVWSCGVILYALLAGYLPFDDTSIRSLLMKVKKGQFTMPPFSPAAQDLISRMLTVDPNHRITIDALKNHDFFRGDLRPDYRLPRAVVWQCNAPLDICEISRDIIDVIRKVGYNNDEELAIDMQSPEFSMAKVFYFMLTSRFSPDAIDWSQCNGGAFPEGQSIIFEGQTATYSLMGSDACHGASPESLSSVHSLAVRFEWDLPEDNPMDHPRKITLRGISLADVMRTVQILAGQRGMQWMHPDEFTIHARVESIGLYVTVQAGLTPEDDVFELGLHCWRGSADSFEVFVHSVEEAFA